MKRSDIEKAYCILKQIAIKSYKKRKYDECLKQLYEATILPIQFNWQYKDDDIEEIMQNISYDVIHKVEEENYTSNSNKYVFIDDFCRSFILTLQYLEAFNKKNIEVLYITYEEEAFVENRSILEKIKSYDNVEIFVSKKTDRIKRAQEIYSTIINFNASKVFLHVTEFSDSLLALYSLPSKISRYMINLADQRFWIGVKAIDYSLEFRPFGSTVSYEKRGLRKEQLLFVPFYPIIDNNKFQGFPELPYNSVILFTGGDFYKTIDPNFTYWRLIKKILDSNENAVVLYAMKNGSNNKTLSFINEFIQKNKFENRFISIGFRTDINEVFKNCDIYLGTCPTSGSLMSQIAAYNAKPILQFYLRGTSDDETEQALCYNESFSISYEDELSFLKEAKKLIENPIYRKIQGERIQHAMLNSDQFAENLLKKINTHDSSDCKLYSVNHDKIAERWFYTEGMGFSDTFMFVSGLLGKKIMIKKFPLLFIREKLSRLLKQL